MKIAVVGSRKLIVNNLEDYIPAECDEIVSGGAIGIDRCAAAYARQNGLKLTEFLPEYDLYGKFAPIKRNYTIVDYADRVIAFWDGQSRGTLSVIKYCEKVGKECQTVFL